jgi:hypothetical protein
MFLWRILNIGGAKLLTAGESVKRVAIELPATASGIRGASCPHEAREAPVFTAASRILASLDELDPASW